MAFNSVFLIFGFLCLFFYLYGSFNTLNSIYSEKNECKMTFMFEFPNYVRINIPDNEKFPRYNLYAYAEGSILTGNARNMIFSGAPVLFIPGNSGSFKQSRSLASVALRKGIDNEWFQHLDYFTVDLNEEYSALFGGVLEEQAQFIEHAIRAILKLYVRLPHPPKKIVVIGHSIGGKLIQKVLTSEATAKLINSAITLATPMDKAVLNLDIHLNNFYNTIENFWSENRQILGNSSLKSLDDKLLISIGGGRKDLMVHSGLTDSKYSDLHVMSTEISKVWVESDHLCIVWCLQLVLVVNRFLYSIIAPVKYKGNNSKGLSFIEDKATRLAKAQQHFLGLDAPKTGDRMRKMESTDTAEWYEDNRRIFTEKFKNGLNRTRIQMIRLFDHVLHRAARIDVINLETTEWIFGCEATEITKVSRFCSQAISISNLTTRVPSELPDRIAVSLNLQEIKAKNPKWTHILLRFAPTREPFQFTVDIHNPVDREISVTMPKWYSFSTVKILDDTLMGASHYQLNIIGLDATHQALELIVTPKFCTKHRTIAKVSIPWSKGFNRFHQFGIDNERMMIWTPKARPLNYNTTEHPISVELMLDSECRYTISIRQSIGEMMAKIVQQFSHWLPAHLVAILCLAFKHQLGITPKGEKFRCGAFHKALATCTPFFVITVSRLFFKFILMMKILPKPETLPTSLSVSILVHGTSLAILIIFTALLWGGISFCGSIAHRLLFKVVHLPIPIISDAVVSIIEKFPASVAALLISLVYASCGGVALIVSCIVYFILLSKMYEDYLETFVFKTAKLIAMKLFGRVRKSRRESENNEATVENKDEEEKPDEAQQDETKEEPKKSDLVNKNVSEQDEKEEEKTQEVEKMLNELMEKQREEKKKREKDEGSTRMEYDSLTEGLDEINFHFPLFFLLIVVTLIGIPSSITWAKNYHYSRILSPDPLKIPATVLLISLGIIWQLNTPRKVIGYKYLSSILYIVAVVSVLYCQDAIYRLTYVITGTFVLIALHQIISPQQTNLNDDMPSAADFFDRMKSNYDRFKTVKGFVSR